MSVLYRYEIEYRSEDGDTAVHLRELPILRETEKTYFIKRSYWGGEKRVPKFAHNAYAHNTKERAKQHFIRRTQTRINWFDFWKEECEKAIKIIEEGETVE